ncbi:MAG: RidA family protein [Saprospiraceae bacterium]|nr:RidA family protein [Lewinella sp.]
MKKCITPNSLFDSRPYGFSQIVIAEPGKMVLISGQVAWDENLNIVGDGDLAVQTEKSLQNLKTAIEVAGGTLEDIVMLRIYKVNYQREDGPLISRLLKKYFGTENAPASTWISVQGLANEAFMIEIEAQAVI